MSDNFSPDDIRKLWKDTNFFASFTGLSTFRDALETEKGIEISMRRLKDIMNESPAYLDSIRRPKRFERRKLQVDGFNELIQVDVAHIFDYRG